MHVRNTYSLPIYLSLANTPFSTNTKPSSPIRETIRYDTIRYNTIPLTLTTIHSYQLHPSHQIPRPDPTSASHPPLPSPLLSSPLHKSNPPPSLPQHKNVVSREDMKQNETSAHSIHFASHDDMSIQAGGKQTNERASPLEEIHATHTRSCL
jgi:hypothetical protein